MITQAPRVVNKCARLFFIIFGNLLTSGKSCGNISIRKKKTKTKTVAAVKRHRESGTGESPMTLSATVSIPSESRPEAISVVGGDACPGVTWAHIGAICEIGGFFRFHIGGGFLFFCRGKEHYQRINFVCGCRPITRQSRI